MEAALPTVGSRHAQPGNHGTSLSDPAAALANESSHMVEHLYQVPPDGSDALLAQTCSAFFNMSAGGADRGRLDRGTGKSRASLLFASEWVRVHPRSRRWPRSSRTRRPVSATFTSGGHEELSRTSNGK